jgi:hypothetical protein
MAGDDGEPSKVPELEESQVFVLVSLLPPRRSGPKKK